MKKTLLVLAFAFALVGASNASAYTFSTDLSMGSTHADVSALQDMLIAGGYLQMPAGVSKGYFGALTKAAVMKWQAANMITPAAGYFGPISRAKASSSVVVTPTPSTPSTTVNGGEASLNDYDAKSTYSNESLEEGETAKVFAAEFDVEDADAELDRVDVRFLSNTLSKEDEPWKSIDEVTLYVNGKKVASESADDEDAWSDEGSDEYEIRFSNLNTVLKENDTATVEVEVSVSEGIDDTDLDQTWEVWIEDEGIRAMDGAGIDQYTGDAADSKTFDIETAEDGELDAQSSSDDLDPTVIVVEEENDTDDIESFIFELEADRADVTVNTLWIFATTSDDDIEDVVKELSIEIDGKKYDSDSVTSTGTYSEYYEFDLEDNDDEFEVADGETMDVTVLVSYNQVDGNYSEGTQVAFSVAASDIDAEGTNTGDSVTVGGGTTTSETHTLRTAGISVVSDESDISSEDEYIYGDGSTVNAERGVFTFKVEVTALDDEAWILDNVGTSGQGFVYALTGDSFVGTSSASITKEDSDTKTNNRHKVEQNETVIFTIEVRLDPNTSGYYGVELDAINFSSSSTGVSTSTYTLPDESEFEAEKVNLNA